MNERACPGYTPERWSGRGFVPKRMNTLGLLALNEYVAKPCECELGEATDECDACGLNRWGIGSASAADTRSNAFASNPWLADGAIASLLRKLRHGKTSEVSRQVYLSKIRGLARLKVGDGCALCGAHGKRHPVCFCPERGLLVVCPACKAANRLTDSNAWNVGQMAS